MRKALKFYFSEGLFKGRITSNGLKSILKNYGFVLHHFNPNKKNGRIEKALVETGLGAYAEYAPAFTTILDGDKYVFIRHGLMDSDEVFLLLHELGHIVHEDFAYDELIHRTNAKKERQADLFAYSLLAIDKVVRVIKALIFCTFLAWLFIS